jgi:hypothetical protein
MCNLHRLVLHKAWKLCLYLFTHRHDFSALQHPKCSSGILKRVSLRYLIGISRAMEVIRNIKLLQPLAPFSSLP